MRTCSRCKTEKDDAEFYKGSCYCKLCAKTISHENYERNKEKILAQQKVYKQTDGKEMQAAANKRYQQSEKGKEAVKRGNDKYQHTERGKTIHAAADKKYKSTPRAIRLRRIADRNRRYEKKCMQDPNYESPFVDVEDLID
jgi:hypothetical protein